MRDPYDVLGVARGASHDEIKKAYRKLAKQLHPDRHPNDARMAERFKEVSAAYHIVGDEKQRARFDRGEIDANGTEKAPGGFHQAYANAGTGAGGGGGFRGFQGFGGAAGVDAEDIFSDLFGGFRRGARQTMRARGADRRFSLKVSFLDAARGVTRRLTLPGGKTLDVKIPAGMEDGKQIRLKHQGDPGSGGAPAGDALIEVRVEPHPFLVRKGFDIHVELPVTLPEAVLGGRIPVPTIDGIVQLTVPKGSNTGNTLRLKGKGIHAAGEQAGDLYVKLKVVLPEKADPALEKFAADWKPAYGDVRARLKLD